jgi:competence protein ComFB
MTRIEEDWTEKQQTAADTATLVYKGLQLVNHNQRPTSSHTDEPMASTTVEISFSVPTIIGRLFDGETFAPLAGVTVELRSGGELVPMRNQNWQNPFTLLANTPGAFTFWPAPIPTDAVGIHRTIEYSLKVESTQYETITHFFKVPTVSGNPAMSTSFSMNRTFKLPDLYLFHPGEAEQNW